jgi:hypothetical protein
VGPDKSPTMGLGSFPPTHITQPVSQQLMKAEVISPPASFTSTWGTPNVAGPPSGPRGFSTTYADATVHDRSHSMALTERPQPTGFDSNRDRSTTLMNDFSGLPFAQAERSLPQDGLELSAQGPFPGRINVHGLEAMGEHRDSILEAAPSRPRAMVTPTPVKIENSRPTSKIEPRAIVVGLTRYDLQKWPCRRCHFVHRGGECETSCIGCGSKRHDKHDFICPFKDKVRQDDNSQVPGKKESMPFKEPPSQLKPAEPQISSTMQLSLECQRRGFNPEFKYYRGSHEGDNRADLLIKDVLISGRGISYKSQKDARDALAPKGLEVVRKMSYGPMTGGPDARRIIDKPTVRSVANAGSKHIRGPPSALRSSSRSQSFPYNQSEKRPSLRETEDPVMDFIKSAQSPPHWRERPANTIVSSASTEPKRMGPSQQPKAKASVVVELPANIESHAARATVEKAVAANPQTNISLHFPANVSVEVAQAYGLAIGAMASSSRRRSRSRSRSPVREVQRDQRDRDRDRVYRDRERDFLPYRSSVLAQRTSIDAYRPSPQAVPRQRVEDYRLRLSPPPESKYYPPNDRRGRYTRDGLDRR